MSESRTIATAVFVATLALTFFAAYLGRAIRPGVATTASPTRSFNRWLIGLSAGAAANSGFVVTGAVGLGYLGGAQFLLLPLGWLVGDILFWSVFPGRINDFGRVSAPPPYRKCSPTASRGAGRRWRCSAPS